MELRFKDENGKNYPDWDKKRLDEIATISKGKGISKNEIDEKGMHSCIRYGELYTQYNENISSVLSKTNAEPRSHVLSESGDILIPASGEVAVDLATASVVNIDNVLIGSDINIVKTKINSIYLAYYLNNKSKKDIFKLAQGSSIMHIYPDSLKKLECAIPKSLEEQEKIGSFFKLQDEVIELKEKLIKEKREYKKGLLQKVFNQELRFKDENGNDYPDWEEEKLLDLTEILNSKRKPITKENRKKGEYPYYGAMGKIDNVSDYIFDEKLLLFGEDGANWNKYYSTAFIINGKTWVNNHAHVMRCVNSNIYYLKNYFEKNDYNIYALGNAPAKINLDTFKNIIINIPKSLEEQEKIGNLFKLIDEEIELLENEVIQLKQKKKYYLSVMM